MNSARAAGRGRRGRTAPCGPLTIGSPYSVTVSVVTAAPRRSSQRGSPYERRTRWAPSRSAHAGSIAATRRAHSRFVSTSSAAITHRGDACGQHRAAGDRERRRRGRRGTRGRSPSRIPMCDSRPASTDWWTRSGWPASAPAADAEVAGDLAQLAEQVLPLAHAQVVEVLGAAQPAELVARQRPLLLAEVVPQGDDRQQVAARDVEAAVQLRRRPRAAPRAARAGPGSTARRRSRAPRARSPWRSASSTIRPSRGSTGQAGEPAADRRQPAVPPSSAGSIAPSSSSSR